MRRDVALPGLLLLVLAGCSGDQSVLAPRGEEAGEISRLFWTMTAFLGLVLVGVATAATLAITGGTRVREFLAEHRFIVGAGLAFPTVSLLLLLAFGLSAMDTRFLPVEPTAAPRVTIIGERWWWRVIYHLPDGARLETANELTIPVGEPVILALETADVIHSFWVPNLAGKVDMIPGRTNRLTLRATEAGVSRGQCAEYCGGAHALMSFYVVARARADFDAWLRAARELAVDTTGEGAQLFVRAGCGACHRIRGLEAANGRIGPDLTHVGSRLSIGAGTLPTDPVSFASWIRNSQHIKPANGMPAYGILSEAELMILARYLEGLK